MIVMQNKLGCLVNQFNNNLFRFRIICVINSAKRHVVQARKEEECPVQHNPENNEYHCTLEEWNNAKSYDKIPGPKPLPFFGNTWRILPIIGEFSSITTDMMGTFQKINKRYGDIVKLDKVVGLTTKLCLFNPSDIEKVYKLEGMVPDRETLPSVEYYRNNMRQDIFKHAKGLLVSHGEDWYNIRNKVNAIMMQPKVTIRYIYPVDEITKEFIARIKLIRSQQNKILLDFGKETNKWSLESIAFIALNSRLGCLREDLSEDSTPAKMIRITEEGFKFTAELDFKPSIWKYISTPMFKRAMKTYDEQVLMGKSFIEKALEDLNEKQNTEVSTNTEPSVLEKLLKIDKNVAIIMALDMLLAGIDTTSTALVNILYYLAKNPEKQEILRNEILTQLPNDSKLTSDTLNYLPYMKACIREAARLYPVTSGSMRILSKNAVISGYQIPKGSHMIFFNDVISQMENQFVRPTEFLPERWLRENIGTEISFKNAHPFCALHFGFGARSCIGRRFAELELEVAVINFMRNFKISWNGPPPKRSTTTINHLSGPYHFKFDDI